jgi:REP element-mobilizing transposase RayT
MARLARVVTTDILYHITQRRNARRLVFETNTDRLAYFRLLQRDCDRYELSVVAYA